MKTVILASASPRRKELLSLLQKEFQIIPARGEEVLTTDDPERAVQELSAQKAAEVAALSGEKALVIGADTVVAQDGQILGKPSNEQEACDMIRSLQGRSHMVYTGVTFIDRETGKTGTFAEGTRVFVSPMTDEQIRNYIRCGESMDKAGAYGIQGTFGAFIERIEGDYNNVVGLPVSRLYRELTAVGTDLLKSEE